MLRFVLAGMTALSAVAGASAQIRITEWMYNGADGEFIEFTNVGGVAVNMNNWSFDDNSRLPGSLSLSSFGVVQPGESVILCEPLEADFRTNWLLPATVDVIGGNTQNLGRADEINLYDDGNALIDRLTFGDQTILGSIRTTEISGNPLTPAALGANDVLQWQLSVDGDAYGSYVALNFGVGNPGRYVPEPSALALLALGGVAAMRRRAA